MTSRRDKGAGSLYQRHDHETCPPAGKDKTRPEHTCRGHWVAILDLGRSGGKRHRKIVYGTTKTEATRKLTIARRQYEQNQLVMNAPTVSQWWAYWLDEIAAHRVRDTTLKNYRVYVRQYIDPHIGHHRIDKLQPEHIRGLYATMRKQGLAEATLRQCHAVIRRGLVDAMRDGKVARNVATLIDPPKVTVNHRTPLTVAQARQVLEQAKGTPNESRWLAALYLGLRQSEALALTWGNVDLDNGVIYIVITTHGAPKSLASTRAVPMPPTVLAAMRRRWVDYLTERDRPGYEDHARVWCQANGRQLDSKKDWKAWRDLLKAADVPHVPLHAARNTAASLLMAAGVDVRLVASIVGHATVQITQNVYQRGDAELYRGAMLALDAHVTG